MEFLITTDLKQIPEKIEFNNEAIKAELSEKLTKYNTLVVTEDSIKAAKSDKASLNKVKEVLETRRKQIKKLCLTPYEGFEKHIKELVALIDAPIKSIDSQVAVFDQKQQDEKWKQISDYYAAEVKELVSVAPLEKIVSPKWKNKTESLETVCNGVGDTLERIRTDLATIKDLHNEFEQQITDVYLKDFNLSRALQEQKRLEEQKKRIEEMEAKKAQTVVKSNPVPTAPPVASTPPVADTPAPAQTTERMYTAAFKIKGTQRQIQAVAAFMKKYNINYEVIK
ncbi:MAG: DUF1351 domain-containing protein [Oscillospiraceae bacterium]|nr:DUF1351 domain-containing protein [Oscillospiraceae bacterium]